MRKQRKRLTLNTETLRVLADGNLYAFRGGLIASMPQTDCCTEGLTTSHADACCYPTNTSNEFTDCC
jgi:hypothetical protein